MTDHPAPGDRSTPAPPAAPAPSPAPQRPATDDPNYKPYDKKNLSYAGTFTAPAAVRAIKTIELLTGKLKLLRRIRSFERKGTPPVGLGFWAAAMEHMGVEIGTPPDEIARIPATGPLVVVSNHPHGLVDGMVIAALLARVRSDFRILTRSLISEVQEVAEFMIPVPFPHEEDSHRKMIDMRNRSVAHLAAGGVVALFPAGAVAHARTWFGPAVEEEWSPFTAKLILRSGATVLPMYFPGQNSRAYQIAAQTSAVVRQGLLLHEVAVALDKPQRPVIGAPVPAEEIGAWKPRPIEFIAWLRQRTLDLRTTL